VAAALSGGTVVDSSKAERFLTGLGSESDVRIRIYGRDGRVLADSRRVLRQPAVEGTPYGSSTQAGNRSRWLYRLGAWLVGIRDAVADAWRRVFGREAAADRATAPIPDPPPEVRAALDGKYGAATRPTPGQRSLTLNSAVPIRSGSTVTGAVVVSQSTFRMLQALYSLRLRIFEIVLASIVLAGLLSALMSATIVRPLVRLRRAAASLAERRAPLSGTFNVVARRDEIGDLARALDELASRLDAHIRLLESFAADVSHEFRNPLASIRTAAEMLVAADQPADRARFFDMLSRDVDRLDRLVVGVRELVRIDAQLAHEPATPVDVTELVRNLVNGHQSAGNRPPDSVACDGRPVVLASADRLSQVFDNILANARSFAPDSPIEISVRKDGPDCRVTIADRGPGIPPAHLERLFERFFTYRPQSTGRRDHSGLGLAIARTIVEGYGGTITAENRPEGGARFDVLLPLANADS
jgi:two-component system sensor histidine kinase ChvG